MPQTPSASTTPTQQPAPDARPAGRRLRAAAWVAAAAMLAGGLAWWHLGHPREAVVYDRFHLPGFDSYVYVAMAERPAVFTVAPWGYRFLSPAIAGWLEPRNTVRGLRRLSLGGLTGAGAALFLFLRRRGHAPWAALLGVAAFGLAPPVARVAELPFFVDPLAVLLLILFLLGLEARAGTGLLALAGVLLAYAKDPTVVLTLAPAVFLARWSEGGPRRARGAILQTMGAVLPAAATEPLLRAWWTPHIPAIAAPLGPGLLSAAVGPFLDAWPATLEGLLVGGLAPLALLGALRAAGRPALRRYGPTLGLLFAMALFAWVRVPSRVPVPLFGENVGRVLIYALPLLITLALSALDRVRPNLGASPPPLAVPRWLGGLAAVVAVVSLLTPLALLDRYRRLDLQGSRDGPLVLAFCRESWRTAARIHNGETVTFTPENHLYRWGETDVGRRGRVRWFLRQGWGGLAHYGGGPIVMHEPTADLVLPLFEPREMIAVLRLVALGTPLSVSTNGHSVDSFVGNAAGTPRQVRIPARLLRRGDNVLRVTADNGARGARLAEISYHPAGPMGREGQ